MSVKIARALVAICGAALLAFCVIPGPGIKNGVQRAREPRLTAADTPALTPAAENTSQLVDRYFPNKCNTRNESILAIVPAGGGGYAPLSNGTQTKLALKPAFPAK